MRQKILIAGCLVASIVLLSLAVADYREWSSKQQAEQARSAAAQVERQNIQAQLEQTLKARVNSLVAECAKGSSAYKQLTAAQKQSVGAAPSCGEAIVE